MLAQVVPQATALAAPLVVAEAVTWPDGSLGCPEPGMFYTQMVVPGYRLIFGIDGKQFDYRMSARGDGRLCTGASPHGS